VSDDRLARECAVFTRHLVGAEPVPYVVRAYAAAHAVRPETFVATEPFDVFTVRFAAAAPRFTQAADAWCRLFHDRGALRRKLILLLAILETAPPSYCVLDEVRGPAILQAAALALGLGGWALALLVGALILTPARLALGSRPR
jgi:hypothetical protein